MANVKTSDKLSQAPSESKTHGRKGEIVQEGNKTFMCVDTDHWVALTSEPNFSNEPITKTELWNKIQRGDDVTMCNTSQITDFNMLFYDVDGFDQDISGWDVSRVTTMSRMFENATNIKTSLRGWNPQSCNNTSRMFYNTNVSKIDYTQMAFPNVSNASYMFYQAT